MNSKYTKANRGDFKQPFETKQHWCLTLDNVIVITDLGLGSKQIQVQNWSLSMEKRIVTCTKEALVELWGKFLS